MTFTLHSIHLEQCFMHNKHRIRTCRFQKRVFAAVSEVLDVANFVEINASLSGAT